MGRIVAVGFPLFPKSLACRIIRLTGVLRLLWVLEERRTSDLFGPT